MTSAEIAALYATYGHVLLQRCRVYLRDDGRAQDALHEVFVRALRGAEDFRGEANPRAWLYRITDRLCLDLVRRDHRNPVRLGTDTSVGADELDGYSPRDCDQWSHDWEMRSMIERGLGRLDPTAQRLAVLHYLHDFTQDELAHELGLSRRTIGKRIKALREHAQTWF